MDNERELRILTLQPFYGGSHRAFMDGWIASSRHQWTALTLPDRHWKWRMRHSSLWMAKETHRLLETEAPFDAIFCTDMLNVPEFKGFLACEQSGRHPRLDQLPIVLYFHENQFAYPTRFKSGSPEHSRDEHFAFTNFLSAVAADHCWFNSRFNLESMLDGVAQACIRWPDFQPSDQIERIRAKAIVAQPGISIDRGDMCVLRSNRDERAQNASPIHLAWAARWEHDKGPDLLLEILLQLRAQGVAFRLSVLGQSFRHVPAAFAKIKERFEDDIEHWGFAESTNHYQACLEVADVFLSSAEHEFFGIAAAEGISMGLFPILPDRLAYPELISMLQLDDSSSFHALKARCMFQAQGADSATNAASLIGKLARFRQQNPSGWQLSESQHSQFRGELVWQARAKSLDLLLNRSVR